MLTYITLFTLTSALLLEEQGVCHKSHTLWQNTLSLGGNLLTPLFGYYYYYIWKITPLLGKSPLYLENHSFYLENHSLIWKSIVWLSKKGMNHPAKISDNFSK